MLNQKSFERRPNDREHLLPKLAFWISIVRNCAKLVNTCQESTDTHRQMHRCLDNRIRPIAKLSARADGVEIWRESETWHLGASMSL